MDSDALIADIRAELSRLRSSQQVPTQLRLSPAAWNQVRRQATYGAFGPRDAVMFDGVPCVLSVGLSAPFAVRCVAMPGGGAAARP